MCLVMILIAILDVYVYTGTTCLGEYNIYIYRTYIPFFSRFACLRVRITLHIVIVDRLTRILIVRILRLERIAC